MVNPNNNNITVIIDGGWLLHQLSTFQGCSTYEEVALNYLKIIPTNRSQVVVVFDGYSSSTKDHEHRRRVKDYYSDIRITKSTACTVTKKKLLVNSNNKKGLIDLICEVFFDNGIRVIKANDDADTLIAREALNLAFVNKIEVRAEDTDVLCLLVHHFNPEHHKDIIFSTKSDSYYSIQTIAHHLSPIEKKTPPASPQFFWL